MKLVTLTKYAVVTRASEEHGPMESLDTMRKIVDQIAESVAKGDKPPALLNWPERRPGLLTMAHGSIEQCAALYLYWVKPKPLMQTNDLAYRDFLFHCVYVPLYSLAVINIATAKAKVPPLMLHEYAAYSLAFERMLLEIIFGRKLHQKAKLKPKSLISIFINPPEGYAFWRRRFEEWRASVITSHKHFIRKQAPDIKKGGTIAGAAYMGNILSSGQMLPLELVGNIITRIEQDKSLFKTLYNNALKPKPARWGEPELDTWLIEIWPLVTMYGWNYCDVWRAALDKWGDKCDEDESFGNVEKIEGRCKRMLGLQLGAGGQARGGRVKTTGKPRRPVAAQVCCFGRIHWDKKGKLGFGRSDLKNNGPQEKTHQGEAKGSRTVAQSA